jgi:catechol 2,3-dioxygenase-like lactoylglutathione lyase family enzyme
MTRVTIFVVVTIVSAATPTVAAVTGACHVSPVVADLDRSVRFYHDLLGLEVSRSPETGAIAWDTRTELLDLHGLPKARLRYAGLHVAGVRCGIEPVEFGNVDRTPFQPRLQDTGTVTLILLVRDIDALFSKLKAANTPVVTTGGAPVAPSPTSKTRAVIVRDPDGHLVELAQLEPPPPTTAPAASNVYDIRFRVTVTDLDGAIDYYRRHLGLRAKTASFASNKGVMAMMGLPESVEYRVNMTPIPGSPLIHEFLELKGIEGRSAQPRVQDPGAYRLQLNVDDIDQTVAGLRGAGAQVVSTGGAPVRMMFTRPWRLAAVRDLNGTFLILQQELLP